MEARTRVETIAFRRPFRLRSLAEVLPAGTYTLHVEEEMIECLSFPAWRRTSTTITPTDLPRGQLLQCWSVLPAELDAALAADAAVSA